MRHLTALAAVTLLALGGCSRDEPGEGGVTSDERRELDNAAAMVENQTFDTSADSLVLDEDVANRQAATDSLGNAALNEAAAQ